MLVKPTTWKNLEDIMLSEASQKQKEKECMAALTHVYKSQFIKTGRRGGVGNRELVCEEDGVGMG